MLFSVWFLFLSLSLSTQFVFLSKNKTSKFRETQHDSSFYFANCLHCDVSARSIANFKYNSEEYTVSCSWFCCWNTYFSRVFLFNSFFTTSYTFLCTCILTYKLSHNILVISVPGCLGPLISVGCVLFRLRLLSWFRWTHPIVHERSHDCTVVGGGGISLFLWSVAKKFWRNYIRKLIVCDNQWLNILCKIKTMIRLFIRHSFCWSSLLYWFAVNNKITSYSSPHYLFYAIHAIIISDRQKSKTGNWIRNN